MEKRKGYKDIEQQLEADKRYLKNNPEARKRKRISSLRSSCRRYIREFATKEELIEFKNLIEKKLK